MAVKQYLRGASNQLGQAALRKLSNSFTGEIILPGDLRYLNARKVWNRAVKKFPIVIARCATREDVKRAIEFAHHDDLTIAIRGGGHSFAGHGVCDGGMVIDLSLMKRVSIVPRAALVQIDAGVLAHELDYSTQAFDLAVPLGSCPTVGVAGYALGGGESALTPKFGYACDSIRQVEIFTADCQMLIANKNQHEDLFWAVRGAGANFGVVVSLTFLVIRSRRFCRAILNIQSGRRLGCSLSSRNMRPAFPMNCFSPWQSYLIRVNECSTLA